MQQSKVKLTNCDTESPENGRVQSAVWEWLKGRRSLWCCGSNTGRKAGSLEVRIRHLEVDDGMTGWKTGWIVLAASCRYNGRSLVARKPGGRLSKSDCGENNKVSDTGRKAAEQNLVR